MPVDLKPRKKKSDKPKDPAHAEQPIIPVSTDYSAGPRPALSQRGSGAVADFEGEGQPVSGVSKGIAPLLARSTVPAPPPPMVQEMAMPEQKLAPRNDIPVAPELNYSPGEPVQVTSERISPSLKNYNQSVKKFPTEEQYVEEHRPEGFWNRLWSGVKTFGKGTLLTGNPIGGLVGATMSAFDPDTEAKITYRNIEEPRERGRQNQLINMASREIGVNNIVEDNQRASDQIVESRNYRNQLMERDQSNRDRAFDLDVDEHKFKVAQYIDEMKRKAAETKNKAERDLYERMYKAAEMHKDYGSPLPPEIARAIGAPALGGQVKPLNDRNTPQWAAEAEAADPSLYGAQSWNDLVDNPEYPAAYQQALEAAKAYAKEGETPEQTLQTLVAAGMIKLPTAKVPAYDLAKKNPFPIKSRALNNRTSRQGSTNVAPRKSATRLSIDDAIRKYQKRVSQGGADRAAERNEFIRQTGVDPDTGKPVN